MNDTIQKINVDWAQLALNLRAHKPLAQIERELGLKRHFLARLARDESGEPGFTEGNVILDYHLDVVGLEYHMKLLFKNDKGG